MSTKAPVPGIRFPNIAGALHYLRGNRLSVSVASTSDRGGTLWFVSGYPEPFDGVRIVQLAETKGFAA